VRLIAVDPWDCGCTECITGEYVPLRYATDENIADLLAGRLRSHLNDGTRLEITTAREMFNGTLIPMHHGVTVRYEHHDGESREWTVDPYRAGLAA
jgi:hypothetical protein